MEKSNHEIITNKQEEIYFIEVSVRLDSYFSGSNWSEGKLIFVKGRENVPAAKKLATLSYKTLDRSFEIRGTSTYVHGLGRFKDISDLKDISKSEKVDIIYHICGGDYPPLEKVHYDPDYDKVEDTISSSLIINNLSLLDEFYYDPESDTLKDEEKFLYGEESEDNYSDSTSYSDSEDIDSNTKESDSKLDTKESNPKIDTKENIK